KLAATPVRPSTYTRIADSLRGLTVPTGVLAVEDEFASQAFKIMQERLRVAKVDPEQAGALLDEIVRADNPTLRSKAVKEAEAAIIKTTARRYGVSERTVERLSQRLSASQDEFNAAVNGQRYTAHTKSVERNGATGEVPADVIVDDDSKLVFFKDDDGVMTFKFGE